ncbi:MAG TPA: SBBP repeat-containing protein, partial [Bryobacteraceae bacterium]
LSAGADIGQIRLRFRDEVEIAPDGGLIARSRSGEFREEKPVLFEEKSGVRIPVDGRFVKFDAWTVGFEAEWDGSSALTIDPSLQFSGYFGGTAQDDITAVAVNSAYTVIAAGYSNSVDLPSAAGARQLNAGGVDAFVAAFSPASGQLLYCTYLGGSGDDRAFGVAVDSANNTYVTGWTSSRNFPVRNPRQALLSGARDAFVTKLDPAGDALVYSTYLGGSGVDFANAIAVDASNQAVIAGDTTSFNLPVTAGAFQRSSGGGQDTFLARLTADGAGLSFLTYFGGNNTDHVSAVAVDPTGPIVIAGGTLSTNLPVLSAAQARSGGGQDAFVTKFNATGTGLVFSTYLGGSSGSAGLPEQVNGLVLGPSRNPVVAGVTSSTNFPVTSASYQPNYGGGQTDGFLTKLNVNTGAIMVSTFYGGSSNDAINALAEDLIGRLYFTGYTLSVDLPVKAAGQGAPGGGTFGSMEAFAATMNAGMNQLPFATYLGGAGSDSGNAIAVDPMSSILVAGQTSSPDFPSSGGSLKSIPTQVLSSFLVKLAPDWTLSVADGPNVTVDSSHVAGYGGLVTTFTYGQAGDIPVVGDWTGTGVKQAGVFRDGTWILDTNGDGVLNAGDQVVAFGQAGDIPITGDWTGSGKVKLGLFRAGAFILDLSGHLSGVPTGVPDATFSFGLPSDIPVVGDWNGSGFAKVGVFRNGSWLVDYNGDHLFNGLDKTYTYGQTGDIPVTGSWDSSGITRLGVYRTGNWILNYIGTNIFGVIGSTELYIPFGAPGQTPIVR